MQPLAYIRKGDYFLFGIPEGGFNWHDKEKLSPHLYRVQQISGTYIFFTHHRVALLLDEHGKKLKKIEHYTKAAQPHFETALRPVIKKTLSKVEPEKIIPVHLSTLGEITKRAYKFPAYTDSN